MRMEFLEYTKIVHNRISKIDPENATKIVGFLLLCDMSDGDQEMTRLAQGPDHYIHEIVNIAKAELQLLALRSSLGGGFVPFASPRNNRSPLPPDYMSTGSYTNTNTNATMYELQNPGHFLDDLIEQPNPTLSSSYVANAPIINKLRTRIAARHYSSSAPPDFHPKICHYYNKGFCKHGTNCRYLHICDNFSHIYITNSLNDDHHLFRTASLENLEFEIVELLKSKRGTPISIASLPMIYYEKYGKVLQADGYLTESQRHGKSGFSLTKLLIRLKRIQVIDRPHGQHAVILAEDVPKYIDRRNDKNEPGPIVSSARQIYMTFPADSTFTEEDVSVYFSDHFGVVEDVRIPCQQRRMFGFVTFSSIETVNLILSQNTEHLICGARVLVKPYREKLKLERRNQERIEHQQQAAYYASQYNNLESEQLHSIPRSYEATGMRRLRIEEQQQQEQQQQQQQQALNSEMNLMAKSSIINKTYFSYQMRELEEQCSSTVTERIDHMLDVLKSGSCPSSGLGLGLGSGSGSGSDSGSSNDDNKQRPAPPSQKTMEWIEGFILPDFI